MVVAELRWHAWPWLAMISATKGHKRCGHGHRRSDAEPNEEEHESWPAPKTAPGRGSPFASRNSQEHEQPPQS